MGLYELSRCCCCFPLRPGVITLAILSLIGNIYTAFSYGSALFQPRENVKTVRDPIYQAVMGLEPLYSKGEFDFNGLYSTQLALYWISAIAAVVSIPTSAMLIYGAVNVSK